MALSHPSSTQLKKVRGKSSRVSILLRVLAVLIILSVPFLMLSEGDPLVLPAQNRNEESNSAQIVVNDIDFLEMGLNTGKSNTAQIVGSDRNFLEIGLKTGTDKVLGPRRLEKCLKDAKNCVRDAVEPKCRTGARHFYHTVYQKWLGSSSIDNIEPFQFLEVGFYHGEGYDAYTNFMPRGEAHSIEISCTQQWPEKWGNFAMTNPRYQEYRDKQRLHCGDASKYEDLKRVWNTKMKRPDAPPLKLVIDDGSHLAIHMATTLFFWFPRIEPGGILVVEDIQPIKKANEFRLHLLPQVMKDLHYCGDDRVKDDVCFPTIRHLLQSVHCEMHICVFERNNEPSEEPDEEHSMPPPHALKAKKCLFGEE